MQQPLVVRSWYSTDSTFDFHQKHRTYCIIFTMPKYPDLCRGGGGGGGGGITFIMFTFPYKGNNDDRM